MTSRKRMSSITRWLAVCAGLLSVALPSVAQTGAASARRGARAIALVADACPEMHAGDKVSLDWNPGFEHSGAVNGLLGFGLTVARVQEDGTEGRLKTRIVGGGRGNPAIATALPNGFYHIELTLPPLTPGVYRIVGAEARPSVYPDYGSQPLPQMRVSPATGRFCITVTPKSGSTEVVSGQ